MYVSKELALILKEKGMLMYSYDESDLEKKDGRWVAIPRTDSESVLNWIFKHEYFYFEEYINNHTDIKKTHWLEFWYETLLTHDFSLMHEFIGRLEEWFENNNYYIKIGTFVNNNQVKMITCLIDSFTKPITQLPNYNNRQQAKHEAIIKTFELLKQ